MRVTKRDGSDEDVSFDKVLRRIRLLCTDLTGVDPHSITQKVCARIYDGVKTSELDELAAQMCASLVTEHPDYGMLAARIIVSNHHKNTSPSFSETMSMLYHAKDVHGKENPLISDELWNMVQLHKEKLNSVIDYERDYLFDYFGFKTLERSYLMKVNGKTVERPQHMWMRVALGIHGTDVKDAIETYDLMSRKKMTHATPTLFNAGTPRPQLASCFLLDMRDSIKGIYKTVADSALISKDAGGIGIHIHDVRARGSHIRGTNGTSTGIVPMLRVLNTTACYVNQGGKRNGSIALYLEPWHADIESFLDIRKNHGNEEERCRDLFTALWIPDLFMKRVQENGEWSLMCPDECPGLAGVYGEEFEKLYEKYESEGRYRKKVKAQNLWLEVVKSQVETGSPYLCYKDHVNKKTNQSNVGVIRSSNLCVAPETQILTDQGYFKISDLEDQEVNVWNGKEFSNTVVRKTGENQELIKVELGNGLELNCTKYHKFYIHNATFIPKGVNAGRSKYMPNDTMVVEAKDLRRGMKLIKYELPTISKASAHDTFHYPYTHGFFCGDGSYTSYMKPYTRLYGEKQSLIPYLAIKSSTYEIDESGGISCMLNDSIKSKFDVPVNQDLRTKLDWLAGYADADGYYSKTGNGTGKSLRIKSVNKEFLKKLMLMLHTLGCTPKLALVREAQDVTFPGDKVYTCQDIYCLDICSWDLYHLKTLGFRTYRLDIDSVTKPTRKAQYFVEVSDVIHTRRFDDTYCFNEPKEHMGIFNGILTGQCSEIMEYSDENEYATCNLASIALPNFIKEGVFDFHELHRVAQVLTKNINKVIDRTYYPVPETERSNKRHRPIGLGVQGLADAYAILRMPFDSAEAAELNKKIFATIYHGAVTASIAISRKRQEWIHEYDAPNTTSERRTEIDKNLHRTEGELALKEYKGAYETFVGSPASQGKLQFDLWGTEPHPMWDWDTLKKDIQKYGMRNSLLLAPMPTASTSQILSSNECFEPFTSNFYQRRTLAGEFTLINKYLIRDLIARELWSPQMKNMILAAGGSVQNIDAIPQDIKDLYKTAWELKQKVLIDQAADRGIYVCQSQSLNLFVEDAEFAKLTNMHFYAWKKGLKTGIYYLRTRPKAKTMAFTLDPSTMAKSPQKVVRPPVEDEKECLMCSA